MLLDSFRQHLVLAAVLPALVSLAAHGAVSVEESASTSVFPSPRGRPASVVAGGGVNHPLSRAELEELRILASARFQSKDYVATVEAARRYLAAGGSDLEVRGMLGRAYFLSGDIENAARELQLDIQAAERAGRIPSEERLRLLGTCYLRLKDSNAYTWSLERLVTYYPRKPYWAELLERMLVRPDIRARLALDVMRLRYLTDTLGEAQEFAQAASLALQAGFPLEAKAILDKGFASGLLGSGKEADQHRRLQLQVRNRADKERARLTQLDGEPKVVAEMNGLELVHLGFSYVTNGESQKGVALLERGLRKGGFGPIPQDTRLRVGIGDLLADQKTNAIAIFKNVGGMHGAADLARVWAIYAQH